MPRVSDLKLHGSPRPESPDAESTAQNTPSSQVLDPSLKASLPPALISTFQADPGYVGNGKWEYCSELMSMPSMLAAALKPAAAAMVEGQ